FWQRHIARWRQSGITQAEYCRRHNLCRRQFTYWKGKLKDSSREPISFIPVKVVDTQEKQCLEKGAGSSSGVVLYRGRYRIEVREGFSAEVLGEVLRVLEVM
ncbi:IS66 family insertion sequence hypothetical protein, partial [Candidatus Parcubacteria bacterium]